MRNTYTPEQLATLDTLKTDKYTLGVARTEYVNQCLQPDGTLTDCTAIVARDVAEVADHAAQERFLFVMGDDGLPLIYFQCDVPHNPDLPPLKEV